MYLHRAPTTALEDDGCVVLTGHHGNCDNVNFDLGDCSSSSSGRDSGTTEGRGGGEQLGGGEEGGGEVASVPVSLLPQTTRNTNTTHQSSGSGVIKGTLTSPPSPRTAEPRHCGAGPGAGSCGLAGCWRSGMTQRMIVAERGRERGRGESGRCGRWWTVCVCVCECVCMCVCVCMCTVIITTQRIVLEYIQSTI